MYTFGWIIDASGDEWVVEPSQLVQDDNGTEASTLAAGGDGRLYRRAQDTGSSRTELIAYDPQTETFERSSEIRGRFDLAYTRPDGDLVLLGWAGESAMVTYDPDTDEWSDPVAISDAIAPYRAEVGFDGNVYVPGYDWLIPQLWAIGIDDGVMRSVECRTASPSGSPTSCRPRTTICSPSAEAAMHGSSRRTSDIAPPLTAGRPGRQESARQPTHAEERSMPPEQSATPPSPSRSPI